MTEKSLRIIVAVNPAASSGAYRAVGAGVGSALGAAGHSVTVLQESSYRRLEAAVRDGLPGRDVLVVVGGDGMVHLGTNAVAGTEIALGIVPTGTGNDLARGLGQPLGDSAASIAALLADLQLPPRAIDALRITGGATEVWAAGILSAGFDSLVNERANLMRYPRGQSRYPIALVLELLRLRRRQYSLEVDGVARRVEAVLIAVANNRSFGGGMRIVPDAVLDDGVLELFIVTPLPRLRLLRIFPKVYSGRHVGYPEVSIESVRRVTIDSEGIVGYADGERIGPLPLTVEVVPGALRVLQHRSGPESPPS